MAKCPKCGGAISFLAALTPGGSFLCKNCQTVIHKKVTNQFWIVLPSIVTGQAFLFILECLYYDPHVSKVYFFLSVVFLSLLVALITLKIVWTYFIKL